MLLRQRKIVDVTSTVIILIWVHTNSISEVNARLSLCPIGFNIAYTKETGEAICYRLKGPESFHDKFLDCTDNLYTTRLYNSLNFTKDPLVLWAEYKSLYPGGPFIDWSYSDATGDIMTRSFEVRNADLYGIHEDLCVIIDEQRKLSTSTCDQKYYRYCFVKPYEEIGDMTDEGCEELNDYWRFFSPKATCLTSVNGVRGGSVRATWKQAVELCHKRGSSLLQRGWRYANNPVLHESGFRNWTEPLGIVMTPNDTVLWIDEEDGNTVVPPHSWNFEKEEFGIDTSFVALIDKSWNLVNGSFLFYNVICERSIHLRTVHMNLTENIEGQLILSLNDSSVDENKIWCFTDSVIFYPSRVKIVDLGDNIFSLKPLNSGYYWCVHADAKNFKVSESNKLLYVRDKVEVLNYYAIKLETRNRYTFENVVKMLDVWSKKLSVYIALTTQFKLSYPGRELPRNPEHLRKLNKDIHMKLDSVITSLTLKQVYMDGKTALLHAQLRPGMEAVMPGFWEGLQIHFMRPVYYCPDITLDGRSVNQLPLIALGNSTIRGCTKFTCVGDFNEGVYVVETSVPSCEANDLTRHTVQGSVTLDMPTVDNPSITLVTNQAPFVREETSTSSQESDEIATVPNTRPSPIVTLPNTPVDKITTAHTPTEEVTTVNTPTEEVTTVNTPTEEVTTVNTPTTVIIPTTYHPKPPLPITTTQKPTTTPTPEQHMQNVLDNLEQMLHNGSDFVPVENINEAFDQVDELLEVETDLDIPGQFLHLLDQLGTRADLNGSQTKYTVRNNIALLVADASPDAPVRGLKISSIVDETFTEGAFQILTDNINSTHLDSETNEVVVYLPQSVTDSERRISFVVFRNDRAFRPTAEIVDNFCNSRVLSINVENVTHFEEGEVIDLHFKPTIEEIERNNSRACAYWSFSEDGTGMWSQDGCTFIRATKDGQLDTCRCTHLTHFAEILIPRTVFSERNERALEIISVVGCCLSLFGLLMVGLTAVLFRSWRKDFSNKIWLQLCIAIFIMILCFVVVIFTNFQDFNVSCMLLGVLLHYSVLASFCWMLVAAILSYRRLVLVFTRDVSHKLLKASAFSWGTPCAIVGVLLSVSPYAYSGKFEEMTPTGVFCYPSGLGLWLTVYAPIALMLLANWVLFGLIVRSVFASRGIQRHGDSNEALRCATVSCLLVFLFGLPWVFGLFASNIVGAYFFGLTSTFQGFVLFVFFVVGNKKTRDMWLNKLKIKQTRKVPVTSSTYKSSGGWRGGSGRANTSIEAKISKPRSLVSSDDSRFS